MTNAYEAPAPEIAEFVHRTNAECDRQADRLRDAPPDELKRVVRDRSESTAARGNALLSLMRVRDPELTDLILELFDDPDQDLWRMAICGAKRSDPRVREKLRNLLDDPDDRNWSEAAVTLARTGEHSLQDRFAAWLETGDEPHRNVAIECLKSLKTPASQAVLENYWSRGAGDDETRLVAAAALLDLGNPCGRESLEAEAQRGRGSWSVFAATSVYIVEPSRGLPLMLHILDHGDLAARQAMVSQIWNFAHLPHAFTADGLAETRVWVESQRQSRA